MKVILFGATGMVGSGVLAECLADARVTEVVSIVRQAGGVAHPKLREVRHADFFDYTSLRETFRGAGACFFCLGVSSFRMSEAEYRRWTHDLTLAAARAVVEAAPSCVFCYVSGEGTDGSATGRVMWARVKGQTENELRALPFRAAYMFRPGYIQPLAGVRSKTAIYRAAYAMLGPLYPLLQRIAPTHMTNSVNVGRAMIEVALHGHGSPVLENTDINRVAEGSAR
ncbi:MAG TPA: NAD(P)H-binding protein [Gemmatimonadales bacterium]|nr:NAD(P)H-binding protein [Gemmatimonadales bacterium]